jgi:hypothetical protein
MGKCEDGIMGKWGMTNGECRRALPSCLWQAGFGPAGLDLQLGGALRQMTDDAVPCLHA